MGKRKSRMSKLLAQPKLETTFMCPFCNNADSVECVIHVKEMYAVLSCFVCKGRYYTEADPLTEPVDVYSEWFDACVELNRKRRREDSDEYVV
jgi:transcription elongation factor Elf1